ncbi:MAG TPA: acyl-CoA thioesterase [Sedimentisphaerales bacterium]|nr:acyl-CoA thioesterase [Sedimentisphaerales bacterium]
MPNDANPHGTIFGGVILSWVDMVASMAAQRHSQRICVTAAIDSISFREPINIGDHAVLRAMVNYTHRTSMEVGVQVIKEDPIRQTWSKATTAYVTLVAVDEHHQPVAVAPVAPVSEDEQRRWNAAALRAEHRRRMRQQQTK